VLIFSIIAAQQPYMMMIIIIIMTYLFPAEGFNFSPLQPLVGSLLLNLGGAELVQVLLLVHHELSHGTLGFILKRLTRGRGLLLSTAVSCAV